MGIHIPEKFNEVYGNQRIIQLILDRIATGTFPQVSLLYAEEGLGKTSLAKLIAMGLNCESSSRPCYNCETCREIRERVIMQKKNTANVKVFKMSGETSAKDVIEEMQTNFLTKGVKVLILDECHRISDKDQDSLVPELENVPKNVYVICCTTDISGLQKTFQSRVVMYRLSRLSTKEMVSLLAQEASYRNLDIQGGMITLELIAHWSDQKPRAALKVLEAMGENNKVSTQSIKDFISFLETDKVVPLIESFSQSLIIGVETIDELKFDMNTYNNLVNILQEVVVIAIHKKSMKMSVEDNQIFRKALENIPTDVIVRFFYEVAKIERFNKSTMLAAFLKCHPMLNRLTEKNDEVMNVEMNERRLAGLEKVGVVETYREVPPSFKDMLNNGELIDD